LTSMKLKCKKIISSSTKSTVMRILRNRSPISRSGIAAATGLTLQALSRTIGPMLENRLLVEEPLADTTGPRRKRGLEISPDIGYCVSISYMQDWIEGCILNTAYKVVAKDIRKVDLGSMPMEEKLQAIFAFTKNLFLQVPVETHGKCLAISVVDPGLIDVEKGVSLTCSILDGWENVPIIQRFEEEFHIPVLLTSGNQTCIRAVDRLELNGSVENLIYLQYDQGVGCSLKLAGHYISGRAGVAGEFGHTRATDQPVPCRCGSTGCLEAVAALPALAKNAAAAIAGGAESVLAAGRAAPTGLDILSAAAGGDRLAVRIVHEAFECLGRSVGGLVNTLAPDMVLFESTVAQAGEAEVNSLFQAIRRNVLSSHAKHLRLQISTLTSHVACLGGAVAVLDYCMEY
jgi:predicted NBD/HSP70 family sugar kinase